MKIIKSRLVTPKKVKNKEESMPEFTVEVHLRDCQHILDKSLNDLLNKKAKQAKLGLVYLSEELPKVIKRLI